MLYLKTRLILVTEKLVPLSEDEADEAPFSADDDLLDDASIDAPGLAILIRTDFSDDAAWQAFLTKLKDAEAEFAADVDASMDTESEDAAAGTMDENDPDGDEDATVDEAMAADASAGPAPIFYVLDPLPSSGHRALFTGISNLTALRLLNDVDVRQIPPPPAGTKRIKPPNRLVDYQGWQEVYTGKMVWVYDQKSNTDQCVRLVSQQSASLYGTAA